MNMIVIALYSNIKYKEAYIFFGDVHKFISCLDFRLEYLAANICAF